MFTKSVTHVRKMSYRWDVRRQRVRELTIIGLYEFNLTITFN